ncbi:MAG: rhodanese-like domain-containing protein [Actinomycetota bacterium]
MAETDLTTPEGLREKQSDVQIVDVREQFEIDAGWIEGSIHIPLNDVLGGQTDGLTQDRPVVAVCTVGQRSELAALMLQARGFEAYNLREGLKAWESEGLPLRTPDGQPGRVA